MYCGMNVYNLFKDHAIQFTHWFAIVFIYFVHFTWVFHKQHSKYCHLLELLTCTNHALCCLLPYFREKMTKLNVSSWH